MAEPKWTPGPWIHDGVSIFALTDSDPPWYKDGKHMQVNRFAARVDGGGRTGAPELEREAIARLMAAAPELYEALERFSQLLRDENRLVAANAGDLIMRVPSDLFGVARAALAKAKGETP